MKFTAAQIAGILSGIVDGDPQAEIHHLGKIESAEAGHLAFLANPKYTPYLYTTKATIVIASKDFKPEREVASTLIRVDDPYGAFATLLEMYHKIRNSKTGISTLASVHPSARIGQDVFIGDFVFVGEGAVIGDGVKIWPQVYIGDDVHIGDESVLHPGVKLYHGTEIGKSCIIHAGVVIGADGFGFAVQSDHQYRKVPQIGNVILEDFVEVGANTTIDRATLGSTIIRRGVKLDNLVQIAHNVEVGSDTVIAALTGVSGSTKIGSRCMVAGQVGFVGHIEVADEVKIGAQSGVAAAVKQEGAVLLGTPAIEAGVSKRILVLYRKLPELFERIRNLEKWIKTTGDSSSINNKKI